MRIALSSALILAALGTAHAQTAALRLACDGDSVRAEVTVNGKFVGECPVDVQVQPGTVKIEAIKRVDAQRERFFSDEFRVAGGTAKRVQIELGPVGPNAEGRRQAAIDEEQAWTKATSAHSAPGYRIYLGRFPQGKHAADAKAALGTFPPRPSFPVPVDSAVLDKLESSEAFAGMQSARAYSVDSDDTLTFKDGTKVRTVSSIRSKGLAPGYVTQQVRMSWMNPPIPMDVRIVSALAGFVEVTSVNKSGNDSFVARLDSIEEISGSLVPPRPGAQLRLRYKTRQPATNGVFSFDRRCVMSSAVEASSLNARLSGKAWPVECSVETSFAIAGQTSAIPNTERLHYLEDYFLFSSAIGTGGVNGIVPIPAPGSKFDSGNGERLVHRWDVAFD